MFEVDDEEVGMDKAREAVRKGCSAEDLRTSLLVLAVALGLNATDSLALLAKWDAQYARALREKEARDGN